MPGTKGASDNARRAAYAAREEAVAVDFRRFVDELQQRRPCKGRLYLDKATGATVWDPKGA